MARRSRWEDDDRRGRGEDRRDYGAPDPDDGWRGSGSRRAPEENEATEMLLEAQALQQEGRIDEAIDLCEEIVATYGRADARYYLAWMYQEEHLWDSAIEHFVALLDDPDFALSCYYALGQCYRAKGDLPNAARYFDEAVDRVNLDQLNHEEAEQLIKLCSEAALTHFELHNEEAAETVYNALLGFLRSRGWQDHVATVERLMATQRQGQQPSGRMKAAAPPTPQNLGSTPPSNSHGSAFLTDNSPAVNLPPTPQSLAANSAVHPALGAPPAAPLPRHVPPAIPQTPLSGNAPAGLPNVLGRLASTPPALPEPQRTQVMHAMRDIETYISHGLYTAAIEECLRIIEIAPQYLDVHQALAEIYVQQGKIDQAITKYAILIDTFLVNGRIDDAITTYRRILQLEPNNLNYHVRLINLLEQHGRADEMLHERVVAAEAYLRMGYPDRSIEQFEKALIAAPGDLGLRQNYALALVRAGKVNQGIGELQRILQIDPNNVLALARWQIVLCTGAGSLSSAGGLANSSLRMMSGDGSTRVASLEVLSRLVRALRLEHQRGFDDVQREYMTAIESSPTNGDLRYGLAVVYHSAGKAQEALTNYQAAMLTPGLEVLSRVGAGLSLLALDDPGASNAAVREMEEASAAVRRVPLAPALWGARPRLDGEEPVAPDVEIAQLLARAYQRSNPNAMGSSGVHGRGQTRSTNATPMHSPVSGFTDEIYRSINDISARHPGDPNGALQEMVQLVRQYRGQRQLEQAVAVLNEITRLVPEDASVRRELADIHINRGLLDEGIEELRRVAEISSRHGQVAEAAQALQQMGEIQWQMGDHQTGMTTLKQVLNLTPDDMATRMLYVQYCLELNMRREAAEQQTILARYYYHSRQTKEAVATLQQLIALDNTNYEAYDLLGQTYFSVGEYDQAMRVYRHLTKLNPQSSVARERLAQIQEMTRSRR